MLGRILNGVQCKKEFINQYCQLKIKYIVSVISALEQEARGKLQNALQTQRKNHREHSNIQKRPRSSSASADSPQPRRRLCVAATRHTPRALEVDQSVEESLEWLKSSISPWSEVLARWAATAELRKNLLADQAGPSLDEYVATYPALKLVHGVELVSIKKIFNS